MNVINVKYTIWAKDRPRAVKFYQTVFDAKVEKQNPHIIELNIHGALLSIHGGGEGKKTWTGLTFCTDDVVEGAKQVINAGGKCEREPVEENGEPPHLAMCEDTEGNQIMLSRPRA